MNRKHIIHLIFLCSLSGVYAFPQVTEKDLPILSDAKMPIYPSKARGAGLQGTVKVRVHTDGKKIANIEPIIGPIFLENYVKENLMTWVFREHEPAVFEVIFKFILDKNAKSTFGNCNVVAKIPTMITITSRPEITNDPYVTKK